MKTKLVAMAFLAAGSMFAQTRFTFSVGVGGYNRGYYNAAPLPYVAERPPCPGPDYFWTGDYWARQPQYGYQAQRGGFYEDRDRDFRRDRGDDRHFDRDHDRRDDQSHFENSGYGNGFRNR